MLAYDSGAPKLPGELGAHICRWSRDLGANSVGSRLATPNRKLVISFVLRTTNRILACPALKSEPACSHPVLTD